MFGPLMTLICSACAFSGLAALMLWLSPRVSLRWWTMLLFVASEYAGAIVWFALNPRFVPNSSNELHPTTSVLIYMFGALFSAVASGWLVTFIAAYIFQRRTIRDITLEP